MVSDVAEEGQDENGPSIPRKKKTRELNIIKDICPSFYTHHAARDAIALACSLGIILAATLVKHPIPAGLRFMSIRSNWGRIRLKKVLQASHGLNKSFPRPKTKHLNVWLEHVDHIHFHAIPFFYNSSTTCKKTRESGNIFLSEWSIQNQVRKNIRVSPNFSHKFLEESMTDLIYSFAWNEKSVDKNSKDLRWYKKG